MTVSTPKKTQKRFIGRFEIKMSYNREKDIANSTTTA